MAFSALRLETSLQGLLFGGRRLSGVPLGVFGPGGPFVEEFEYVSGTRHWRAVGCDLDATDCHRPDGPDFSDSWFLHSNAVRSVHDPSVLFRYVFHGWFLVAHGRAADSRTARAQASLRAVPWLTVQVSLRCVHWLAELRASCLACSISATRLLSILRMAKVPGGFDPSVVIVRKPIFISPTGRGFGFFTQVQFGPPRILLFCSGIPFMLGPLLRPLGQWQTPGECPKSLRWGTQRRLASP